MTGDLPVPFEALREYARTQEAACRPVTRGTDTSVEGARDDVRAIAGPIVAAELRRIADSWVGTHIAATGAIHELRARADQMDPQ